MSKISFVTVRKGDLQFGSDQVRTVSEESFKKTFGNRSTMGAKENQSVIVQLSEEQVSRIEKGEKIAVSELGVFSSAAAASISTENKVLKTELESKDALIARLQAELEAKAPQPYANEEAATQKKK